MGLFVRRLSSRHYLTLAAGTFIVAALSAVLSGQGQAPAAPAAPAGPSAWDGAFTSEQADRGRAAFAANCAECHGDRLQGGIARSLSGDAFWNDWGDTTIGDLLGFVSKNMPDSDDGKLAGTLPITTYQDVVAHILRTNGLPPGGRELTLEASSPMRIVNRSGPRELAANTLAHIVGCLEKGQGGWRLVRATRPQRVVTEGQKFDVNVPLGERQFQLMFVLTPLDKYAGYRMAATGLLLGDGGVKGLNLSTITPIAQTCQ
jgi:hypothetical protein